MIYVSIVTRSLSEKSTKSTKTLEISAAQKEPSSSFPFTSSVKPKAPLRQVRLPTHERFDMNKVKFNIKTIVIDSQGVDKIISPGPPPQPPPPLQPQLPQHPQSPPQQEPQIPQQTDLQTDPTQQTHLQPDPPTRDK
jgi:hypothetical protein